MIVFDEMRIKSIKLFFHRSAWRLPSSEFYDVIIMEWKKISKTAEMIFGERIRVSNKLLIDDGNNNNNNNNL